MYATGEANKKILQELLLGKRSEYVASHAGRSQYSRIGGGISTCGLAAVNCARIVLQKEKNGLSGEELLLDIMTRSTVEAVLGPCLLWTSSAHLDVDEIHHAPIFSNALRLVSSDYGQPSYEHFHKILLQIREHTRRTQHSTCVVITRPPEIIVCINIATPRAHVLVTFDSHPRPGKHPQGAAFIFMPMISTMARYLADLFHYDEHLLQDDSLQWQAQLLSNFSGHIFAAQNNLSESTDWEEAALQASLEVLSLRAEVSELKAQKNALDSDNSHLNGEVSRLQDEIDELATERWRHGRRILHLTAAQDRSQNTAVAGPSHAGPSRLRAQAPEWQPPVTRSPTVTRSPALPAGVMDGRAQIAGLKQKGVQDNDEDLAVAVEIQMQYEQENSRLGAERSALQRYRPSTFTSEYGVSRAGPSSLHTQAPEWQLSAPRRSPALPVGILDRRTQMIGLKQKCVQENDDDYALALETQIQYEREKNKDLALALETQLRYEQENARLEAERSALQRSVPSTFECGVCFDRYPEDVVAIVEDCRHRFCRECIQSYVSLKLKDRQFPIPCPMCSADKDRQKTEMIDVALMQQLNLTQEQQEIIYELQMVPFSVILHCRRCQNMMFVDKLEYEAAKILTCPLPGCLGAWCKACSQETEIGGPQHSCDGSSELKHLMGQHGWKYCPGCQTPAEKISGCNHMTCMAPRCNTHFCYVCGELIVKSLQKAEIKTAVSKHYQKCQLFAVPEGI